MVVSLSKYPLQYLIMSYVQRLTFWTFYEEVFDCVRTNVGNKLFQIVWCGFSHGVNSNALVLIVRVILK